MAIAGHTPGRTVVGVTVFFTALAAVMVIFRNITRIRIIRNSGIDDYAITAGLCFSLVLTTSIRQQVKYGMGRHIFTLSAEDDVHALVWFYVSVWAYNLALCLTKVSILLQYLRIFPSNTFRRYCFVLLGIIIAFNCWAVASAIFACWPIEKFWHRYLPGTCLNREAVWLANAVFNILTDACATLLPIPTLKHLQMPRVQKRILILAFGLGGLTCLMGMLRLYSLYTVSIALDVTWQNPMAAIWSSLEVNVGIICCCVPPLRVAAMRLLPNASRPSILQGVSGSGFASPACDLSAGSRISVNQIDDQVREPPSAFSQEGVRRFRNSCTQGMQNGSDRLGHGASKAKCALSNMWSARFRERSHRAESTRATASTQTTYWDASDQAEWNLPNIRVSGPSPGDEKTASGTGIWRKDEIDVWTTYETDSVRDGDQISPFGSTVHIAPSDDIEKHAS